MAELRIIHVDMDAFFAAVEQRDRPEYRGRPVVIGGPPQSRGVVATASYEARRYGIHSAMPSREAYRLCPQAVFITGNMEKYQAVSRQMHGIFARYTGEIEPISLDEAFLDVTGQDAVAVGQSIRARIREELHLTASVGVSYNKFLAKLASDMDKPDGFTIITAERAQSLLPSLPIRRFWGVGPRTEEELNRFGIATGADLLRADASLLQGLLGKRGEELRDLARGIDPRPVEARQVVKSLGEETTFEADVADPAPLLECLREYAFALGRRLARQGLKIRTVTIKLRFGDFVTITRSRTIDYATDDPELILNLAGELLAKVAIRERRVRLIGLTLSHFLYPGDPEQLRFAFRPDI